MRHQPITKSIICFFHFIWLLIQTSKECVCVYNNMGNVNTDHNINIKELYNNI